MITANIQEIFYSYQGEGALLGTPMLFVRFTGCNLSCSYCDTATSWQAKPFCSVETIPFSGKHEKQRNDLTVSQVVSIIESIKVDISWIAFTGGEPLLQAEFIAQLIKVLGARYYYMIETNGTLHKALPSLLPLVDLFSVDFKVGQGSKFSKFVAVLQTAGSTYYVKYVWAGLLPPFKRDLKKIASQGIDTIYVQPMYKSQISGYSLYQAGVKAQSLGVTLHLTPQLHKYLKIK